MCLLLGCTTIAFSQAYQQEIAAHREKYKNEFLEDDHSPLKQDDLAFLRFYAPDPTYIVHAKFTKVDDPKGFDMQTHNGVIKKYYTYGYVTFQLKKKHLKLFVYQSEKLKAKEGYEDYNMIKTGILKEKNTIFPENSKLWIYENGQFEKEVVLYVDAGTSGYFSLYKYLI